MAIKDYYGLLGIARTESPSGIRAAYSEFASGDLDPGTYTATEFNEIDAAFSVLSDPHRRMRYDRVLELYYLEQTRPGLLHDLRRETEACSIVSDAHDVHPSLEALQQRLLRNFTGRGVPKAEKPEPLSIEVVLNHEDVSAGGLLEMGVPVYEGCPACGGNGHSPFGRCADCDGEGMVPRMRTLELRMPQPVDPNAMPECSLEPLGIQNLYLRLLVRVAN